MSGLDYDLSAVRADGWLEALGAQTQSFRVLCDVVGERFVAFSLIAGVRVTGLVVDSVNPSDSMVQFVTGEDQEGSGNEQELRLSEFRRRLVETILGPDRPSPPLGEGMGGEDLARVIGGRYLLLAPLYGLRLLRLVANEPGTPPEILLEDCGNEVMLTIPELRGRLRDEVRRELQIVGRGPFALDLGLVEPAVEALAAGDPERTIALVGSWPGPLSLFLRTPAGQSLPPEQKEAFGRALAALGEAFRQIGRATWAEETFRLGLQYAPDGPVGAKLFGHLGDSLAAAGRAGEAIGPYRRALALGGADAGLLVALARAFADRRRMVAAVECYCAAVRAGADASALERELDACLLALGEAGEEWRGRLPM